MINPETAALAARSIYFHSSAMLDRRVHPDSLDRLASIVLNAFQEIDKYGNSRLNDENAPLAIANLLKLIGETIQTPLLPDGMFHEKNVSEGQTKTCPVFPFDRL